MKYDCYEPFIRCANHRFVTQNVRYHTQHRFTLDSQLMDTQLCPARWSTHLFNAMDCSTVTGPIADMNPWRRSDQICPIGFFSKIGSCRLIQRWMMAIVWVILIQCNKFSCSTWSYLVWWFEIGIWAHDRHLHYLPPRTARQLLFYLEEALKERTFQPCPKSWVKNGGW